MKAVPFIILILFLLKGYSQESRYIEAAFSRADSLWMNNRVESIKEFDQVLQVMYEKGNLSGQLYGLASKYAHFDEMEDWDEASKTVKEVEKILSKLPKDAEYVPESMMNNAVYFFRIGELEKALSAFLSIYNENKGKQDDNTALLMDLSENISYLMLRKGDLQESLIYNDVCLNYLTQQRDYSKDEFLNLLSTRSEIFRQNHDFESMILLYKDYKKTIKLNPLNLSGHWVDYFRTNAIAYIGLKKPLEAKAYVDSCASFIQKHNLDVSFYVEDELYAQIYTLEQNCPEAVRFILRALDGITKRFEQRPNHPGIYSRYLIAGQAYTMCTTYDSALYYYQQAMRFSAEVDTSTRPYVLPEIEAVRYPNNVIPVLIERAKTLAAWYEAEGDLQKLRDAYESYQLATQLIDRLRKGFRSSGSKLLLSEDAIPTFEAAIKMGWKLYELTDEKQYLHDLVSLMEQNKASLLLEKLKEGDIKAQLGVPDSVLERERELRIDIAYYQKLLYEKTEQIDDQDSSKIAELRQKIFSKEESLRQMQDYLAREYPDYYQLKYQEKVADIGQIQSQLLQDDDYLIEYFWGDSSLISLGIGNGEIRYHEQAIGSLEPILDQWRDQLSNRQAVQRSGNSVESLKAYQQAAYQLYQALIEPVVPRSGLPNHLLLIPDGPLALLPFDVLLTEASTDGIDFRTLPYLLRRTNVHYAYSATLLLDQQPREAAEEYYAGYAPTYGDTDLYAQARDYTPLDSGVRDGFSPLLYNQQEVAGIALQYEGQYWTGNDASEAKFKLTADKYRILHLAMHAFTHDETPNLSGLVFSPPSENAQSASEDGILHTYEIYDLKLNADLAVLSACNTGIGKLQKGEGVMSLARAFTYAGCPSLLMSLWQADDEATRKVMDGFFANLQDGLSKSTALKQAKLDFLANTDRPHPHYWGAFVVIGQDQPVKSNKYWPWLLGLGTLALGALIAYPKLKKVA